MLELLSGFLGTGLIACVGWAYNLSNRIVSLETQQDGLHELIESKFDEVNRRLGRIEDAMNGQLRGY